MRLITQDLLDDLMAQAARSERGRVPYRFHEHHEPVQRMLNAIVPGSYITPHKHVNPDKVELISILAGQAAVLEFSESGAVEQIYILRPDGALRGVDIAPGIVHNFVAITPCVVLEIIQGPYQAETHKKFMPWAPTEGTPEAAAYLTQLEALVAQRGGAA
ncbi:MAG: WbuC family cupin fold metalloprotein [Anaerolineae bacterium]|nr:WbuC family cupin fold metalloprotein [Anaerolineae bacterium]